MVVISRSHFMFKQHAVSFSSISSFTVFGKRKDHPPSLRRWLLREPMHVYVCWFGVGLCAP